MGRETKTHGVKKKKKNIRRRKEQKPKKIETGLGYSPGLGNPRPASCFIELEVRAGVADLQFAKPEDRSGGVCVDAGAAAKSNERNEGQGAAAGLEAAFKAGQLCVLLSGTLERKTPLAPLAGTTRARLTSLDTPTAPRSTPPAHPAVCAATHLDLLHPLGQGNGALRGHK